MLSFFSLQRGYRVEVDKQPFMIPLDRVDIACARNANEVRNEVGEILPNNMGFFCFFMFDA